MEHHPSVIALIGLYLLVPSGIRAQSQQLMPTLPPAIAKPTASAATPRSNDTLEIPVVVQPGQPQLDPTFVGIWCGVEQFVSYDAPPSAPEPADIRQSESRCYSFARSGSGVIVGGRIRASPEPIEQHFVSQSADAVSAREIL